MELTIAAPSSRPAESVGGLEVSGCEWRLDPERYRAFIQQVTGTTVDEDISPGECYRIGNLIEGFVDERRRSGEWTPECIRNYPDVTSREEVLSLARFFRHCHEQRAAATETGPLEG
jgi:hypothetical protein